ncbi:uncharacterized protein LOC124442579 [Xenia sp. Carnegie-2017]|uniref:uncharacterized protein LOC124442579 n=1 Tax=Xenia sp. Carnegie-2017 TaxID=2897299 RepID=UPI001F0402BA|nr:uncharacterized protein LOC124442579 [Xenia sp. Carnegie-2017]
MNSFLLLLNEISHELTNEQLSSLIHICNIPGGIRSQMNDGLALFRYLMTQDWISPERIGNLRYLIRKMRPKRRDLVKRIDDYIRKEFQTDDIHTVLGDFTESYEHMTLQPLDSNTQANDVICHINCGCVQCACNYIPTCYTFVIVLLILGILITVLFWYAKVPQVTHVIETNSKLKSVGKYIVILEVFLLLLVIVLRYRSKIFSLRICRCHDKNARIQEDETRAFYRPTSSIRGFYGQTITVNQIVQFASCILPLVQCH